MHRKKSKKTMDDKQDKMIEQLKENQKALKEGIDNIIEANMRAITLEEELPKAIEAPAELITKPKILNVENIFNKNDKIILNNYKLTKPKDLTQIPPEKLSTEKKQAAEIAKVIGREKGKKKTSDEDKLSYDIELQTLKKYRETIKDILSSIKYMEGTGIYTQKKRNAYKKIGRASCRERV